MAKHAARPAIPVAKTGYGTWFLHLAIRRSKLKSQSLSSMRRIMQQTQNRVCEALRGIIASRPSRPRCWLFLQRMYSHTHLLCGKAALLRRYLAAEYDGNLAILWSPSFLRIAMLTAR